MGRTRWLGAALTVVLAASVPAATPTVAATAPASLRAISPIAGPTRGGNQLTISGTHMFDVTAVRFGAAVARRITHVSATVLTVRVPQHAAGAVDVRLVSGTATSARTRHGRYSYSQGAGDLRWGRARVIDPDRGALKAVSCGSPTFCVAVESRYPAANKLVRFTSDGTTVVTTAPAKSIDTVACASATYCIAGDAAAASEWDGHAWSAVHRLADWSYTEELTCAPQSTLCVMLGNGTSRVHHADGWHTETLPYTNSGFDASCPTESFCLATDGKHVMKYDGTAWTAGNDISNGPDYLTGLSCSSASYCLATGGYWAAEWDPTGWSELPMVVSEQDLSDPWCIADSACLASASYTGMVRWDGARLHSLAAPPVGSWDSPRSCLPGAGCVIVDDAGHEVAWSATTHTWGHARNLVPAQGELASVSCTSTTWCLAVDARGNALRWIGTGWTTPTRIDRLGALTSVSCVSRSFCAAVGTHAVMRTVARWRAPAAVDKRQLTDVSCPSVRFCVAVDVNGRAVTWRGHGWSQPVQVVRGQLLAVSCDSATHCVAVGEKSAEWAGGRWHAIANPPHSWELTDVECSGPSYCTSGGDRGFFVRHDGLWSRPIAPAGGIDYVQVSCATKTFCIGWADYWEGTDVEDYAFDGAAIHQRARYWNGGAPDCVTHLCATVDWDTASIGRR